MARLDNVCSLNMGQSPDSSSYNENGDGLPFFQGNADFGEVHPKVRVWCNNPTKIAHPGDILISVRAPIGALNIADRDCCIGRGLAALKVDETLCTREYLWYAIQNKVSELRAKGTGSTFKAVSKNMLGEIEIPLLPIERQNLISAVFDKLSDLISLRKQQLAKLDELVKARFVEMFGDPVQNVNQWSVLKWHEVFTTKTGKLDSNSAVYGGEYPFFTCAKEWLWIDKFDFDCEALLLAGNNASGIYDVKYYKGKFNAYQRTYVLTLKDNRWEYSLFKYQLERWLTYLQNQSKGTNTRYLTLGILKSLYFIIPPVSLQFKFALFSQMIDKQRLMVHQSLDELEILKKSLMQEYFK